MDCTEDVCETNYALPAAVLAGELVCPPDRVELGRHTWTLLHTAAAHYPSNPSDADKATYAQFYNTFARVYPCRPCAKAFRRRIEENPPAVESREALSIWICERHNEVNRLHGKPEFPCTLKQLDLRWKKGPEQCYTVIDDEFVSYD
jgi:FAD-linked sulfhydryl oxidase